VATVIQKVSDRFEMIQPAKSELLHFYSIKVKCIHEPECIIHSSSRSNAQLLHL